MVTTTITAVDKNYHEKCKSSNTAMDVWLFKAIGLYHLLRPCNSISVGHGYRTIVLVALWLTFGLQVMQVVRLYLTLGDFQLFLFTTVISINGLVSLYKGYVIVTNADKLWTVLDVARYRFTSCGYRDKTKLRRCGKTISIWLRTYVVFNYILLTIWALFPWVMNDHVPFVKLDGSVGHYRQTMINMWFPVSENVHNWTPVWTLINVVETVFASISVISWIMFDCYMVFTCMVLSVQFRTMSTAYEMLGQESTKCADTKSDEMNVDYHDELISHIKDNQKIMKKFDDLFDITQPAVLVQITGGTYSLIGLIYFIITAYQTELSMLSFTVTRYIFGFVFITFQVYIYCYVLNILENAKSSLNFELYSSNWIAMDIHFKKTLLKVMCMNSAHKRVMKLSPIRIINLEMFTKVIRMSFSIVSVLININGKNTSAT